MAAKRKRKMTTVERAKHARRKLGDVGNNGGGRKRCHTPDDPNCPRCKARAAEYASRAKRIKAAA